MMVPAVDDLTAGWTFEPLGEELIKHYLEEEPRGTEMMVPAVDDLTTGWTFEPQGEELIKHYLEEEPGGTEMMFPGMADLTAGWTFEPQEGEELIEHHLEEEPGGTEMMFPGMADLTGWTFDPGEAEELIEHYFQEEPRGTEMMFPGVADLTGWTFEPEDEELIELYLGPKVRGEQKPYLCFIPELDVYATEPWNLGIEFRHGKNRDSFFCFTRVARSGASNGRLMRGAGNGTWHAGGQSRLIHLNGEVAGRKMSNLKFMIRAKKGGKPVPTSWIMHEYRLFQPPIDDQGREMVLYRIQKSGTGLSDDRLIGFCYDSQSPSQSSSN